MGRPLGLLSSIGVLKMAENEILLTSCGTKPHLLKLLAPLKPSWTDIETNCPSYIFYQSSFFRHDEGYLRYFSSNAYFDLIIPTRDRDSFILRDVPNATGFSLSSPIEVFAYNKIEPKGYLAYLDRCSIETTYSRGVIPPEGRTELSVDCFVGLLGGIWDICIRERCLLTKTGCHYTRTIPGHYSENPYYRVAALANRICSTLGLCGLVNLQCFLYKDSIIWFDVNPRPGGSVAASVEAGLNIVGLYRSYIERLQTKEVQPPRDLVVPKKEVNCYFFKEHHTVVA